MDLAALVLAATLQAGPVDMRLAPAPRAEEPPPVVVAGGRWDDLSDSERARALENFRRYEALSPEKRRVIDQRYERWEKLPSAEKDRARRRYEDRRGRRGRD